MKVQSRLERRKLGLNKSPKKSSARQKRRNRNYAHDFRIRKSELAKQLMGEPKDPRLGNRVVRRNYYANQFILHKAELIDKVNEYNSGIHLKKNATRLGSEKILSHATNHLNDHQNKGLRKISDYAKLKRAHEMNYLSNRLGTVKDVNVMQIFFSDRYKVGSNKARLLINYKNKLHNHYHGNLTNLGQNETGAWHSYTMTKRRLMGIINKYLNGDDNVFVESYLSNLINDFYVSHGILINSYVSANMSNTNLRVNVSNIRKMTNEDWPTMKDLTKYANNHLQAMKSRDKFPILKVHHYLSHHKVHSLPFLCLTQIVTALHKADSHRGQTTRVNARLAKQILRYNYDLY